MSTSGIRFSLPLVFLFLLACTSVPETPDAQFRAGMDARQEGNLDGAFTYFQKVIDLEPGHRDAQLQLVSLHMDRDEPDHAVAHLTKLIGHLKDKKGTSPSAGLYARRGQIYYQAGNYKKAIRDTTRALERNPRLTEALNTRGMSYISREFYREARTDFRTSIDVEENAQAYLGLATIQMRGRRWKKANEFLDRAIELNDQFARAYLYRAVVNREQNRSEKMMDDLRTYLQLQNPGASKEKIREEVEKLAVK